MARRARAFLRAAPPDINFYAGERFAPVIKANAAKIGITSSPVLAPTSTVPDALDEPALRRERRMGYPDSRIRQLPRESVRRGRHSLPWTTTTPRCSASRGRRRGRLGVKGRIAAVPSVDRDLARCRRARGDRHASDCYAALDRKLTSRDRALDPVPVAQPRHDSRAAGREVGVRPVSRHDGVRARGRQALGAKTLAVAVALAGAVASLASAAPIASSLRGGTYRVGWEAVFDWSTNANDPTGEADPRSLGIYSNLLLRTLVGYNHVAGAAGRDRRARSRGERARADERRPAYTFRLKRGVRFGPPVNREDRRRRHPLRDRAARAAQERRAVPLPLPHHPRLRRLPRGPCALDRRHLDAERRRRSSSS